MKTTIARAAGAARTIITYPSAWLMAVPPVKTLEMNAAD